MGTNNTASLLLNGQTLSCVGRHFDLCLNTVREKIDGGSLRSYERRIEIVFSNNLVESNSENANFS